MGNRKNDEQMTLLDLQINLILDNMNNPKVKQDYERQKKTS